MEQYLAMFYIVGILTGILIGFFIGYHSCEKDYKDEK